MKIKLLLFIIVGAILGFTYYYFFGCESGCSLKSSPTITTLYGAGIGLVIGIDTKSAKK